MSYLSTIQRLAETPKSWNWPTARPSRPEKAAFAEAIEAGYAEPARTCCWRPGTTA